MPMYASQEPAYNAGGDCVAQLNAPYANNACGKMLPLQTEVSLSDVSTSLHPHRPCTEQLSESSGENSAAQHKAAPFLKPVPMHNPVVIVHMPTGVRQRRSRSREASQRGSYLQTPTAVPVLDWEKRVDEPAPPLPAAQRPSSRPPVVVSMPAEVRQRIRSREVSVVRRQPEPVQPEPVQPSLLPSVEEAPEPHGAGIYVSMPANVRDRCSIPRDSNRSSQLRDTTWRFPYEDSEAARSSSAWQPDSVTRRRSLERQRSAEAERATQVMEKPVASAPATEAERSATQRPNLTEAEGPAKTDGAEEPVQTAAASAPVEGPAAQEAAAPVVESTEAVEPRAAPPAESETTRKKKKDGKQCCTLM